MLQTYFHFSFSKEMSYFTAERSKVWRFFRKSKGGTLHDNKARDYLCPMKSTWVFFSGKL